MTLHVEQLEAEVCVEKRTKARESRRKWKATNPEKHKECQRNWYIKNIERERARQREKYAANPERHKELMRKNSLKNYGITPEDYDTLLITQKGRCACCRVIPGSKQNLHVDHCHKTGKIRGLLCYNCNLGIGHARDSVEILETWIAYLRGGNVDAF